jgi:hypothetical protein
LDADLTFFFLLSPPLSFWPKLSGTRIGSAMMENKSRKTKTRIYGGGGGMWAQGGEIGGGGGDCGIGGGGGDHGNSGDGGDDGEQNSKL